MQICPMPIDHNKIFSFRQIQREFGICLLVMHFILLASVKSYMYICMFFQPSIYVDCISIWSFVFNVSTGLRMCMCIIRIKERILLSVYPSRYFKCNLFRGISCVGTISSSLFLVLQIFFYFHLMPKTFFVFHYILFLVENQKQNIKY